MARAPRTRLREAEARILALRIAATMPNNEITTKQLKELVPDYIVFTPIDLEPSDTRAMNANGSKSSVMLYPISLQALAFSQEGTQFEPMTDLSSLMQVSSF